MTLAFAVVFVLLAKFGFPVIVRAIESRKAYIDRSLDDAREAERRLRELDAEGRESVEKLVEKLEEDDDVVNVYHTMKEPDEE